MARSMKLAGIGFLLLGGLLFGGTQDSEFNVNTRYTVETIKISGDGWTTDPVADRDGKISSGLRKEIAALIGNKLNPVALDDLAHRLRKEFHARTVEHHVLRGKSPEYVQVIFDVKLPPTKFDVSVPKFVYNSRQGWSGAVEGTISDKRNGLTFGLVSDGDDLVERYTGLVARYENTHLGTDRVRLRFQFESYHDQWNNSTLGLIPSATAAMFADTSGVYRTRQNFEPVATIVLAKPLTLSFGASFERFQEQFPAAHPEAANALITTLRYHRRLEGSENQQDVDAGYALRAATKTLGSDFVYGRHHFQVRYQLTHGKHTVVDDLTAGVISGQAPLFERYVLGNSSTLRGWNKYELDPLGGNRMVHNSVEYRYGVFQVFYDAGAIWDSGETTAVPRHSIGVGLRQGSFSLAMAFPVREGRVEPILMVGMNY
jgi:hypothetical protein